jgi:hypothetical protein
VELLAARSGERELPVGAVCSGRHYVPAAFMNLAVVVAAKQQPVGHSSLI